MLTTTLILAACIMFCEHKLATMYPWIRPWLIKHKNIAIWFSIGLGFVLCTLFGAAGLIVMTSGILAAVCMRPYYAFHAWKMRRKNK